MIATHNIKVNGKWYRAGDEYQLEEPKQMEIPVEEIPAVEAPAEAAPVEAEEPKAQPKTRPASARRKTNK